MPDFVYMIETRLSPEQQTALKLVQKIARDRGMNVYLTGGTVRDFFTGAQVRDLDFSVQGNALNLLKDLEKAGAQIQATNEHLQVLHLLLPGRVRAEIASTRTERYEKPSKPEIHPATMVEDLRRRDFTANAMALSLNPGSFALFMDPLNGVADIEAKVLRVVHNYGFYEEPSRMVRAARFLSRFGWTMEERTQARYETAKDKENNYIENIAKSALGYELEQVMHEPDPLAAMRALEAEGYLKLLYPGWSSAKVDEAGLQRVAEIRDRLAALGLNADPSMANAEYLTKKMPEKDVVAMQKMMPLKGFVEAWRKQEDEAKELAKRLTGKEADLPSQTWKLLMSSKPETILYLTLTNKQPTVEKQLENFFQNWPQFRQKMPYTIMTELRIVPELAIYQPLLDEMFLQMIDGKLQSEEDIRAFLQPHSPPLPVAPPHMGRRGRGKKSVKATKAAKTKAVPAEAPGQQQAMVEAVAAPVAKAAAKTVAKAAPAKERVPVKAATPQKAAALVKAAAAVKKTASKNIAVTSKNKPLAKKSKAAPKAKSKPAAKPAAKAKKAAAKKPPAKKAASKAAPKKAVKKPASKPAKSGAKKASGKKSAKAAKRR